MLTNLLQPVLLARVVTGVAAAALAALGLVVAARLAAAWRPAHRTELQHALERRAELVAAVVQMLLAFTLAGLALTALAADELAGSVEGAMCAWGVFASTRAGLPSLALSAAAALGAALWVVLHRLDLRMTRPTLTRAKFLALLGLAPLVIADAAVALAFALELDLSVVATCCSTSLGSAGGTGLARGAALGAPGARALAGGAAAAAAALASAWAARRVGPRRVWLAAALSAGAAALALPAITGYVAPHAFELPEHTCPFCLLHAEVGGLGWPLFGALFVATASGAGLALVELARRRASEPEAARDLERALARGAAASWALALAVAAAPVLRWQLTTGGAPLFGGAG